MEDADKAMECDFCNQWEHLACVRRRERPSEGLYQELMHCHIKSVLYVCSCCCRKGPMPQCLCQLEKKLARVDKSWLASAHYLEEWEVLIKELRQQNAELLGQHTLLQTDVVKLTQQLMGIKNVPRSVSANKVAAENSLSSTLTSTQSDGPPSLIDTESEHSGDDQYPATVLRRARTSLNPPGFKELSTRVSKFSGEKASDNFEIWLDDFSGDCGWKDPDRARWFSWFLTGAANASWLHSLKPADKTRWDTIVAVFKGEYGVHLDPRTAYQHCHELRYDQFGSSQGLLAAMQEYQHMAPQKLTDVCLESILWNKVPVKLQQEVKEIPTDGSVNAFLQKLLRAEAVIQERPWRAKASSSDLVLKRGTSSQSRKDSISEVTNKPLAHSIGTTKKCDEDSEVSMLYL